jgi:DNA-binding NarL/FixJ family response regulator
LVVGIAARQVGRLDLSVSLLEIASAELKRPALASFAELHCAVSLRLRGRSSDLSSARTHLETAAARARELSLPSLLEQAETELAALPGNPGDRSSVGADPRLRELTPREREVLALVATGFGDKEIAAELSLAAKTVSNHVHRIMRKANCGNRTELAVLATRNPVV